MTEKNRNRKTYHHGDLPNTLISEAAKLLTERGIESFSMREVARRAGVAVAAPSHHFGSAKGLLTAVAAQAFGQLITNQNAAMAATKEPVEKVIALCRTYVAMGDHNPGCASIMFRLELLDEHDEHYRKQSTHAFDLLRQAVKKAVPPQTDASQINRAAKSLWATMHGLVALELIREEEAEELVCFTVRTLLNGLV